MATIQCNSCSAPIELEAGKRFVSCPYCQTQIYLDKSGVYLSYIVTYRSHRRAAEAIFKRWSAGSRMAVDMPVQSTVTACKAVYYPVHLFKRAKGKDEVVQVFRATSQSLYGLKVLKVPGGSEKIFDKSVRLQDMEATLGALPELWPPDIDMDTYQSHLEGEPREQALVYVPMWLLDYTYQGKPHQMLIDGSSGETFADDFPRRNATPYRRAALFSLLAFTIVGCLAILKGDTGLGLGLLLLTSVPVYVIAHRVASRL